MKPLVAVDLCCGGGGWSCAARLLPIRMVAAVDLWPTACGTNRINHPATHVICGDLREDDVRAQILKACQGGIDLVLGAIPCEWLSSRRMRNVNPVTDAEREGERKTLAAVLDLVDHLQPRYWCLEDVKGLAAELPRDVVWLELNSQYYSAQCRKRIYVGQFPAPVFRKCSLRMGDRLRRGPFRIGKRAADRRIVTSMAFQAGTIGAAVSHRKSPTICNLGSRHDAQLIIVDAEIAGQRRQLEWQEAARLQGFPEDYVFYGSPTDVWKMIGQAVQIDTARAILEEIVRDAQKHSPRGPDNNAEDGQTRT